MSPDVRLRHLATGRAGRALGLGAAGALLALVYLGSLVTVPGLFQDEAAIGYDSWAIAHGGMDEHGARLPLYFESFGDFKSPLYFYALAPLTRLLPLTPYVERLPAALCGLGIAALVALIAHRLTGSRPVVLLSLLTAGLEPWLIIDGRFGVEPVVMILCVTLALWCVIRAVAGDSRRWWAGAGVALGLGVYAYAPGRLFSALMAGAVIAAAGPRGWRRWGPLLIGPAAAYLLLGAWSLGHPGALLARYRGIGIDYDHAGPAVLVHRFVSNYLQYTNVPFLFTHGSANLREHTGFGGMLLVTALPPILIGIAACAARWRETVPRLALVGAAVSPIPAALTAQGTPQGLRSNVMLPFLLLLAIHGWEQLWPMLAARRSWLVVFAAALAIESAAYLHDLVAVYPARAAAWFQAGELEAVRRAHDAAGGHTVVVSSGLDPLIHAPALFALRPDPRDYAARGLASVGMRLVAPADVAGAAPGDLLMLGPDEKAPPGATALFTQTARELQTDDSGDTAEGDAVVARVYRMATAHR